ncbi:thiamine-phosphate kinase [Pseudonocardia thermophila]|uniref:Thiamine-monophosphate kinase n=1 Tax=Pseudonocardia thermophila TaxID=1848 RepID=A0A1M6WP78_PSETH|nr:thiamine-phosphate kinase [Pseudonocardia thermophila]SHK95446.1 thiamine-phosphate kinase [Pseudonocardia thermophila]
MPAAPSREPRPAGQAGNDPETVADLGEFGLISALTGDLVQPPTTLLGPGDDAAVVAAPDARVTVTTDVLVEGVHFRLDWSTPEQIGRKAAAVNLADVAAMGATPTALLVGLVCPPTTPAETVLGIGRALREETEVAGAAIVGGDVTAGPVIVLAITAMGNLGGRPPVTRAGARPGDVVALCGTVGRAATGLAVLSRGFRSPREFVDAQRVPSPPYAAGPQAAKAGATSMVDVSDGLLADLGHVAEASGVLIDLQVPPVPPRMAEVGSALGVDPVVWLMTGGEDHALAATFPPDVALPEGWERIGVVREGGPGVLVEGRPFEAESTGWDHFR